MSCDLFQALSPPGHPCEYPYWVAGWGEGLEQAEDKL